MKERVLQLKLLNITYELQKYELVFFRPTSSKTLLPTRTVSVKTVRPKKKLKYIGVCLYANVSFRWHIEEATSKVLRVLSKIRNIALLTESTL